MARTGYKIYICLDDNPNSPTYMQTYTERVEDQTDCPVEVDDLILVSNECEVTLTGRTGYRILIYYNKGTGEYTEVREEDAECIPSSQDEQWVASGNPFCETTEAGLNTGYMIQVEVQKNIELPNYGEVRYNRYKSPECGANDCPVWDDLQKTCHISVINCVATFDGTSDVTQIDINPLSPSYNQTRTINVEDSGCTNCTNTEFEWVNVGEFCGDADIICDNGGSSIPKTFDVTHLTFRALEDGQFKFSGNSISYSTDSGYTWETLSSDTYSPVVHSGDTIMWKASGLTPSSSYGIGRFSSTGRFNVEGNIMSLCYGDDFIGQNRIASRQFRELFSGCTGLASAENLILPATNLSGASYCYRGMFYGCSSLTTAPELPATTLTSHCYYNMFYGCRSLTVAPQLPATTLADSCYSSMFEGCTSLTTAPELPATRLANYCYNKMFKECTSLTSAPELPAYQISKYCYFGMFVYCTSLTDVPIELPAPYLEEGCYREMFVECSNITSTPELPAMALANYCYYGMFAYCSRLKRVVCHATDISATNCTDSWLYGVASSGTFYKNSNMNDWTTGDSGIPNNWNVVNI